MVDLSKITQGLAFIPAVIINMEVAKTENSFLGSYWYNYWHSDPFCGSYSIEFGSSLL